MSWKSWKISADQLFLKELCPIGNISYMEIAMLALWCAQF